MRVLRIISSTNPALGGPIEGLLRTALTMEQSGHHTEIASLDHPNAPWLTNFPLRVHAMGPRAKLYGYAGRLVPWLRKNCKNYDVAIVHGLWNYSSFGAWRVFTGSSLPYVVFVHGMLDPWFKATYPLKHMAKQIYWLACEGRVLRDAQTVLFTSEEERRLAATSFWGHSYRGRVVSYGTPGLKGDGRAECAAFRAAVPGIGARPFLLFLSRIHPKKGCDLLVRAFASVASTRPDLALVMAGPDQVGWKAELDALASSLGVGGRIEWPGMLAGDVKWGALRAAEALVLPSHQENFGIVVAEAMSCETPVLITDKVNIWREVERSGGGLVSGDNEVGVRDILDSFLSRSAAERREIGARAREGFLAHFHIDAAARDLIAVLEDARKHQTRKRDALVGMATGCPRGRT